MTVDDSEWTQAVIEWVDLAREEGIAASLDSAKAIQKRTRSLLSTFSHAPGTRTPSPPGAPPAMISGRLSASVQAERDGNGAIVGPTRAASSVNGPYGRFLELGGEHTAHNASGYMWWQEDGRWHAARSIEKAPRPYLKPATEAAIASGEIHDIYWRHWLEAQEAVTG